MIAFSWLYSLVERMLHFLGIISRANSVQLGGIPIFVQTNTGRKILVHLKHEWKISDVKAKIAQELSSSAEDIRIIFAGTELSDEVKVSDCDLGERSVLHAIQIFEKVTQKPTEPMNKVLLDLDENRIRAHFFIFCGECDNLRQGKLRVRCSNCKEGAIITDRGPQNWSDVRKPQQIRGICELCPVKENFVEFYFKCSESSVHRESPALNLVKMNSRRIPCLACADEAVENAPVIVFDCGDRHVICLGCFILYAKSRLNERRFTLSDPIGYTLPCPINCEESHIEELRHFKLLGSRDYERYQKFAVEEFVLQSGGVLCPWPNCGTGILPNEDCKEMPRKITCQNEECKFVFCRLCLQGFHIGECDPIQPISTTELLQYGSESAVRSRWEESDEASKLTIKMSTKPCPKCRTPTERAGGCMHISCTKSACQFQWCWICQTEWSRECMASHWFG